MVSSYYWDYLATDKATKDHIEEALTVAGLSLDFAPILLSVQKSLNAPLQPILSFMSDKLPHTALAEVEEETFEHLPQVPLIPYFFNHVSEHNFFGCFFLLG